MADQNPKNQSKENAQGVKKPLPAKKENDIRYGNRQMAPGRDGTVVTR